MSERKSDSNEEAKLPEGWSKGFSRSQNRNYFCHAESKHTQWHFPTASDAADPVKAKERAKDAERNTSKRPSQGETPSSSSSKRPKIASSTTPATQKPKPKPTPTNYKPGSSVAIIVPYRDIHEAQNRAAHLSQFLPYMHTFLRNQLKKGLLADYHIYIIEQSSDGRKFNRGKLLNIGFDLARKGTCRSTTGANRGRKPHDVFIFHDVDLLPNDVLGTEYGQFPKRPLHIARVWDRYSNNPKYFGGVVSFSAKDMDKINGYPNTFWGWGGEDDEMQSRCEKAGVKWDSPDEAAVRNRVSAGRRTGGKIELINDLENMDLHEKLSFLRRNKKWKCMVKWEAMAEHATTWKTNGLSNLSYQILKKVDLDKEKKGKSPSTATAVSQHVSRATNVNVDVKLNKDHWANDKCGMDYMG